MVKEKIFELYANKWNSSEKRRQIFAMYVLLCESKRSPTMAKCSKNGLLISTIILFSLLVRKVISTIRSIALTVDKM